MPRSDGTVVIDTKIDMSGLNRGTADIGKQFGKIATSAKKLGALIGSVFAVREIIQFGKESSNAARQLSDAMSGLQSIVEGQGRSFTQAQAYIDEYISDGLVPATNAITAYKNLASRGYDDEQIKQVMLALKDAASFGRQASLSIGDAVQSATEGLKNENSVLVDNAGVTKNVAAMWEEYAASIGTTANNLTKQQKIQAEVQGILEETKYQLGDSAKVAGTLSGQIMKLQFNLNNLKVAIGNVINPILRVLIPVVNVAVTSMTRFANSVASVVNALFGAPFSGITSKTEGVSAGLETAADNADQLAKSAKEAKKTLAGFDELNRLGGKEESADVSVDIPNIGTEAETQTGSTLEDKLTPQIEAVVRKIKELIAPLQEIDFSGVNLSLSGLGEAFGEFCDIVGSALGWAWENILVPLSKWTIESAAPAAINFLSAAIRVVVNVLSALRPLGQWLWDNFLKPIAKWTGGVIVDILNWLTDALLDISDWVLENQDIIQTFAVVVGAFAVAWELVNGAIKIWNVISVLATAMTTAFGAAVAFLTSPIGLVVLAIAALIAIVALLAMNWDTVKVVARACWAAIKSTWNSVSKWFSQNVVEPISKFFSDLWNGVKQGATDAWNGIKGAFSSIAGWLKNNVILPVSNGFKNMVNGVIGLLNALISGIVSGVNATINALNRIQIDIPDWVPYFGGGRFGFNLRTIATPQIPYLAKGAVIPPNAPFAAVLGDQKHGTNIEAPLSTIQEAVALVMEDLALSNAAGFEAIVSVLREILEAVLGIEVGDDVIGQAVERYNRKMAVVRGG